MAGAKGSTNSKRSNSSRSPKKGAHLRANASAPEAAPAPLMDSSLARDMSGLALAVVAIVSLIAVVAPGSAPVTRAIAGFYHLGFGLGGYIIPFAILGAAALTFVRDRFSLSGRTIVGGALIFVSVIALIEVVVFADPMVLGVTVSESDLWMTGGYVGFWVASILVGALGRVVAGVVLVGCAIAGAVLVGFSLSSVARAIGDHAGDLAVRRRVEVNRRPWGDEPEEMDAPRAAAPFADEARMEAVSDSAQTSLLDGSAPTTLIDADDAAGEDPFVDLSAQLAQERAKTTLIPVKDTYPSDLEHDAKTPAAEAGELPFEVGTARATVAATAVATPAQPIPEFLLKPKASKAPSVPAEDPEEADASPACDLEAGRSKADEAGEESDRALPPLSILRYNPDSASSATTNAELKQTAESLQATLGEFKLRSTVVGWISGPTVTTFKVQPGEGERVSKIQSLEDDIALTLAAQSVRIFAPIPGTSLVGIEIPNQRRQDVYLGDVLPYVQGGPLELAIGRDVEGDPVVADLAKMPHLLIAGTTGSGKSVMINSIITTLLMRSLPEDVRLIMVDPKRVELSGYNGLPHLYVPVVTEPKQAASALAWGVTEMERRLKVFERIGVRNIATFNAKQAAGEFEHYDNPPKKMPYLVIIIDELSDLMMVAGKDVEASIVRIAQLGRAAGIHLIVATQRPSSNVVTGLIKANITNRIAFQVATGIDSRVVIDQMGAEKLTGYGDMLFSKVDWGKPKRIQGCFVSDEEIEQVVEFVKEQGEADYHEEILSSVVPATMSGSGSHEPSEDDPLIWDAARLVVESKLGSTSGIQRRLKVGYARAGRIMDMLEEKGVVGPPDGSKPREVLLSMDALEELIQVESKMGDDDGIGGL